MARFSAGPNHTAGELRRFGFGLGAGAALIFGLVRPWLHHSPVPYWPWLFAIVLWLAALLYPSALSVPMRALNQAARAVAWLVTLMLCAVMYYGLFAPVGCVIRALGRDPIARGFDPALSTYRVPSRERSRESMERPF